MCIDVYSIIVFVYIYMYTYIHDIYKLTIWTNSNTQHTQPRGGTNDLQAVNASIIVYVGVYTYIYIHRIYLYIHIYVYTHAMSSYLPGG